MLLMGSLLFDGERVLRDPFVYIKNGIVIDYGTSPVPEDYTFATLTLGGEGRVIMPGLAVIANPLAYPLRLFKPTMKQRSRYYVAMGREALLKVGLPGVYELHMSGATTIIVEAHTPEIPLDLAQKIGGFYGLAIPSCIEEAEIRGSESSIVLGSPECGPGDVEASSDSYPIIIDPIVYNAGFIKDVWRKNLRLRTLIDSPLGIEKGKRAEIIIYDLSKPPGMIPDFRVLEDATKIASLYEAGLKIETLIAGQDVLVDGGEHLMIVEKHFSEARKVMKRILRNI